MHSIIRGRPSAIAVLAGAAIFIAGCGSSSSKSTTSAGAGAGTATTSSSATSAAAVSSSGLGAPKPAKGSPVNFGMINLELNPQASFPEYREAAQAAIKYVNAYGGGLDGHPVQLNPCLTDGSPATSTQSANKLVAQHPVAIMGGADLVGAATLPLYQKAGLAYIGGMNLTPAESAASNSVIFNDTAQSGNSDIAVYAAKTLHAKKIAVITLDNTQGISQAKRFEVPAAQKSGATAKIFAIPASQADATSSLAAATGWGPDAFVLEDPAQCVAILSGLKSLGNTKPILSIDPCSSPAVIKASAGGAEGMYFPEPYQNLVAANPSADVRLTRAIFAKYAPAKIPLDSVTGAGISTVMNIWAAFKNTPVSKLKTAYMLKVLRAGSHNSFLGTTYDCGAKQEVQAPSVCSANQYIYQIKDGTSVLVTKNYTAGANVG